MGVRSTYALLAVAVAQQLIILYFCVPIYMKNALSGSAAAAEQPATNVIRRPNRRSSHFVKLLLNDDTPHSPYRTRYNWAAERAWRMMAHELQAELIDMGARPRGRNVINNPVAFFINLDRRGERRRAFEKHYESINVSDILPLVRFSAVDGRQVRAPAGHPSRVLTAAPRRQIPKEQWYRNSKARCSHPNARRASSRRARRRDKRQACPPRSSRPATGVASPAT
jgi:hypothetical protein